MYPSYNNNYSIFLDCNKDGMTKFYNKNLENSDYYLYDKDSREDMQSERVKKLELWLKKYIKFSDGNLCGVVHDPKCGCKKY